MNGNLSNTSVFGTDEYEEIQLQYEEMSRSKIKNGHTYRENEEDDYVVDYLETLDDLCIAGFVIVNGRCIRRD